ncbi:multicopper oxidase [Xylariaceae sp. FL0662B]|nr:multicopper oxidase [Xylariaceae sp. FL0662B]
MASFALSLLLSYFCYAVAWAAQVKHTLRFTWEQGAPNGQSRDIILTNGNFPGPNLVFDEDDDVEITVHNDMPRNTTVHWHGIAQIDTPWSDGVIGLTQKPIQTGESFVYRFKASPPGTHWYHSHEQMSLFDGLYGGILVRPKENLDGLWSKISNDTDDIKAMTKAATNAELAVLSDWSQYTSDEYWKANEETNLLVFCVDSILMNGQGGVYCPSQEFLIEQTAPGIAESAFPPGVHVTDKGCLPFTDAIEGHYPNMTHPEKTPPHLQDGCIPSEGTNATVEVDPADGWVSINFIAATTSKQVYFSIDEHPFWIYEVDGNYVEPQKYVAASISTGERFSAMVKLDKPVGTYTIRLPDSGATQVISGFANLVYKGSNNSRQSVPYVTYGGLNASEIAPTDSYEPWNLTSDNMPPYPPTAPALHGDEAHLLVIGRTDSPILYTMNTKYMYPITFQADHPLLFYPNSTLNTEDENLVIRTKNGSWVDLIVQVSTLPNDMAAFEHVIHKHGSKTWRIGQGQGLWNYSSVAEAMEVRPEDFNLVNPGYRDSWLTAFSPFPVGGYWSVFRYQVTNPGPWLFHCHFELHAMGGMSIAILDGVDAWPQVPADYAIDDHPSNLTVRQPD